MPFQFASLFVPISKTVRSLVDYYNRALQNARKIGNRYGEGKRLNGLAKALIEKGTLQDSIRYLRESIQIGQRIDSPEVCIESGCSLSLVYLFQNDLVNARATIKTALQYDVPQHNHNASALHGIIALQLGDAIAARGAFTRAIAQADEILAKTPEYYEALDAKGLAMCGLVLCAEDDGLSTVDHGKLIQDAVETFRVARKIAPHAGIVKSMLRLFDELAKCDPEGLLEGVREAVEGKES